MDWSYRTIDPSLLRSISSSGCKSCQSVIDQIEDFDRHGAYVTGGRIRIQSAEPTTGASLRAERVVLVKIEQDPAVIYWPGEEPERDGTKPEVSSSAVYLSWRGGSWQVLGSFNVS